MSPYTITYIYNLSNEARHTCLCKNFILCGLGIKNNIKLCTFVNFWTFVKCTIQVKW
jgi:hypothetical protein